MKEFLSDKKLNIKTTGDQKGFLKSVHHNRYEPTPYSSLDLLFIEYRMNSRDHIVDFGCGKGRLNFYINYVFDASVVGIEANEALFYEALENKDRYLQNFKNRADKIDFQFCLAEDYQISPSDNCFYFFNPFSVQLFMNVINNIIISAENYEREVDLILYYPSEDYIYYLETQTSFELEKEIKLPDNNPNERFLIYRMPY